MASFHTADHPIDDRNLGELDSFFALGGLCEAAEEVDAWVATDHGDGVKSSEQCSSAASVESPVQRKSVDKEPVHKEPVQRKAVALKTKNLTRSRWSIRSDRRHFRKRAWRLVTSLLSGRPGSMPTARKWPWILASCVFAAVLFSLLDRPLHITGDSSGFGGSTGHKSGFQELQSSNPDLSDAPKAAIDAMIIENEIPANFLFRPVLETSSGTTSGGLAFAAYTHDAEHPFFMSTLARLGPAGGLSQQIEALDLFTSWRSIALFDPLTHRARGVCTGRPKIIPGAKPFPAESPHGDVFAVGNLPTKRLNALPLSAERPAADDPLWIVLPVQDVGVRLLPCRIDGFDGSWMRFGFEDIASPEVASGLQWAEVSDEKSQLDIGGAPIVNAAAEVVGVTAAMQWKGDRWMGHATLTVCFHEYL